MDKKEPLKFFSGLMDKFAERDEDRWEKENIHTMTRLERKLERILGKEGEEKDKEGYGGWDTEGSDVVCTSTVYQSIGEYKKDEYFISDDGYVHGITDGIGGWERLSYPDNALPIVLKRWILEECKHIQYYRELVESTSSAKRSREGLQRLGVVRPWIEKVPSLLVEDIMDEIVHQEGSIQGSSALLFAMIDPSSSYLSMYTLGSSQLMLIREGKVLWKSEPLYRSPLEPKHLGSLIDGDDADNGHTYCLPVHKGDIIVSGSDGFFQNLYDHEIVASVEKGESVEVLGEKARERSKDGVIRTPFGDRIMATLGIDMDGGYDDDITVVHTLLS